MKGDRLRPCDLCKSPVACNTRDGKAIDFHVVIVEHEVLNLPAIQRHAGLAMMLGSEQLAGVMGPNEDLSLVASRMEVFVCSPCWLEKRLYVLSEAAGRDLPLDSQAQGVRRC